MGKRITHKELEKIISMGEIKRHPCGDNLYINITPSGTANWGIVYNYDGKRKYKGLGVYHRIHNTLAMARTKSDEFRVLIKKGIDPMAEQKKRLESQREAEAKQQLIDEQRQNTFEKVAKQTIEHYKNTWKCPKTIEGWEYKLKTYAYPIIGGKPVAEIDKADILAVLEPIWYDKYPSAKKLREHMEKVFRHAIYFGFRTAANPAIYKENLEIPLPKPKNRKVEHRSALSYKELPVFMAELQNRKGTAARALEFLILNGNRTTEVRKAKWAEFDLNKGIWTIPVEAGRLQKTGKSHIVPLSEQSITLLQTLYQKRVNEYVFPNDRKANHLSNNGMDSVIKRMRKKYPWSDAFGKKITVHGFRSTMRDFVAEKTTFDRETAETVLAHTSGDEVERSYRRGDLLEKRKMLMQVYADYAFGKPIQEAFSLENWFSYEALALNQNSTADGVQVRH